MNFLRFIFSTSFLKQILYLGGSILVLFGVLIFALKAYTLHQEYLKVPDLKGISITALPSIMQQEHLRFEIIDSTRFVPDLPPLSVIEHLPAAGSEVKKNRKIYLTVNPSGYRTLTVPNLIQITRRNAESMIKAVGFELGEITYEDNIGKDMVLTIGYQGKKITPGTLLPKTSKIDLVLGNGKR
ncbi:MAG: PASTA domain-containing protein [Bacteroidetes bacterium]|nr:PASTA domain-containing protein [Bacteroidota bacterium]